MISKYLFKKHFVLQTVSNSSMLEDTTRNEEAIYNGYTKVRNSLHHVHEAGIFFLLCLNILEIHDNFES